MVPHRSSAALAAFLMQQGQRWCKQVKVVVSDGSRAYKAAIDAHLGHARHVLDRFHVIRWFAAGLTQVRRDVQRREPRGVKPAFDPQVFGARFARLRRGDTLTDTASTPASTPTPASKPAGRHSRSSTASTSPTESSAALSSRRPRPPPSAATTPAPRPTGPRGSLPTTSHHHPSNQPITERLTRCFGCAESTRRQSAKPTYESPPPAHGRRDKDWPDQTSAFGCPCTAQTLFDCAADRHAQIVRQSLEGASLFRSNENCAVTNFEPFTLLLRLRRNGTPKPSSTTGLPNSSRSWRCVDRTAAIVHSPNVSSRPADS